MNRIDNGGPAFPEAGLSGLPNGEFIHGREGMTLRDYFAAKAMQGFIAGLYADTNNHGFTVEGNVAAAYAYADAMLKAREKP